MVCPFDTTTLTLSFGKYKSTLLPNFIIPYKSPLLTLSPSFILHTILLIQRTKMQSLIRKKDMAKINEYIDELERENKIKTIINVH